MKKSGILSGMPNYLIFMRNHPEDELPSGKSKHGAQAII